MTHQILIVGGGAGGLELATRLGRTPGKRGQARITLVDANLDDDGQVLMPARELSYDSLVIAVGSTTNDFGTAGAAEHCLFLDTREQAERFHRQLLSHYLRAHAR